LHFAWAVFAELASRNWHLNISDLIKWILVVILNVLPGEMALKQVYHEIGCRL
jgi:hypothetical protein